MQPINYYQLFSELLNSYQEAEIIIEISVLNEFVKRIRSHNIFCEFDYSDLEEYAARHPVHTFIENSKLIFSLLLNGLGIYSSLPVIIKCPKISV